LGRWLFLPLLELLEPQVLQPFQAVRQCDPLIEYGQEPGELGQSPREALELDVPARQPAEGTIGGAEPSSAVAPRGTARPRAGAHRPDQSRLRVEHPYQAEARVKAVIPGLRPG